MKLTRVAVVVLAGMLTFARDGRAQSCLGNASFASGAVRLGVSGTFTDGSNLYAGELALGAPNGAFVSGSGGSTSHTNGAGTNSVIGATVGLEVAVAPRVSFCPLLHYTHTSYPDVSFGNAVVTTTGDALGFGGALGATTTVTPNLDVIPYVSAEYVHATTTASEVDLGSQTESQGYGIIAVGAGLVINKVITFRPSVSRPIGFTGAKTSVAVGVSINFGHVGGAH